VSNLKALEYLQACETVSNQVGEEEWRIADRAMWAAYELMGLQGRIATRELLGEVRTCAMEILKAFPDGLPEPKID